MWSALPQEVAAIPSNVLRIVEPFVASDMPGCVSSRITWKLLLLLDSSSGIAKVRLRCLHMRVS